MGDPGNGVTSFNLLELLSTYIPITLPTCDELIVMFKVDVPKPVLGFPTSAESLSAKIVLTHNHTNYKANIPLLLYDLLALPRGPSDLGSST